MAEKKHRWKFPGEAAFIYWLFHWRQPAQSVLSDEQRFGYDVSVLYKVFTAMNKWNLATHGHLLENLGFCAPRLPEFNQAIVNKIISLGEIVPDAAHLTSLLGDGSIFRTCKPSVRANFIRLNRCINLIHEGWLVGTSC